MKLDLALEQHRQRKLTEKKLLMTMLFKRASPTHSSRYDLVSLSDLQPG
jgi:hypothetical protein